MKESRESLTSDVEELRLKLATAESRLAGQERRRSMADKMGEEEKEKVLEANDELKEENRRLKKYIIIVEKRHKKETALRV